MLDTWRSHYLPAHKTICFTQFCSVHTYGNGTAPFKPIGAAFKVLSASEQEECPPNALCVCVYHAATREVDCDPAVAIEKHDCKARGTCLPTYMANFGSSHCTYPSLSGKEFCEVVPEAVAAAQPVCYALHPTV